MSHRAESIPTHTKNEELDNTQKVENMRKAQLLNDVIEEYGTSFYIVKKWEDADWEHIREIEK